MEDESKNNNISEFIKTMYPNKRKDNFINNSVEAGDGALGAAVINDYSVLNFNNSTFEHNGVVTSIHKAMGGAIYNSGKNATTIISNSTFSENYLTNTSAAKVSSGAAVYNGKNMTITGTDFENNIITSSAAANSQGAAVANVSVVTEISDSTFTGNTINATSDSGKAYGGAIYNSNTINSLSDDTFTSNRAEGGEGYGGAIAGGNIGEVVSSTFTTNYATTGGGAIYNSDGSFNDGRIVVRILDNSTNLVVSCH